MYGSAGETERSATTGAGSPYHNFLFKISVYTDLVYKMPHRPRQIILKLCPGHANPSSGSSSTSATPLKNGSLRPKNTGSTVQLPYACHIKRNPSNDARLQHPQNTALATVFTACTHPFACLVKSRLGPANATIS